MCVGRGGGGEVVVWVGKARKGVQCSTRPLHTTRTRKERSGMLRRGTLNILTSPDFICGRI